MTSTLQGIDLTDSCVLSWNQRTGILEFIVEFSLWPESPLYRKPKIDEWTCYRRGALRFEGVIAVEGLKKESEVGFSIDPDGSKDFGNIETFEECADCIRMSGDFGCVLIRCSSWKVDIE
jgi:hypothetical protein